jgi:hypothetical protein
VRCRAMVSVCSDGCGNVINCVQRPPPPVRGRRAPPRAAPPPPPPPETQSSPLSKFGQWMGWVLNLMPLYFYPQRKSPSGIHWNAAWLTLKQVWTLLRRGEPYTPMNYTQPVPLAAVRSIDWAVRTLVVGTNSSFTEAVSNSLSITWNDKGD